MPDDDTLTGMTVQSYKDYDATMEATPIPGTDTRNILTAWLRPITRMHRIPVFKRLWLYVIAMAAYTILVFYIAQDTTLLPPHVLKEAGAAAYMTIVMGMLLVFRTNSAYERWWEGRKQWGQLVNDSRNLCIKVRYFCKARNPDKVRFAELVISFAYALKHHLRGTAPSRPLPGTAHASAAESTNLPLYLAGKIYEKLIEWQQSGQLESLPLLQIDTHARAFMDICGACERIKKSPIAVSYRAFMRQGIVINLIVLPWLSAQEFTLWLTLPTNIIATYFLVGLELIAEDIEEPFGHEGDDLPLDNICSDLRKSISTIIEVRRDQSFTGSITIPRVDPLKE